MKQRITQHSSRKKGSAKHNDRNFDIKKAKHINAEKTKENIYYAWTNNFTKEKINFKKGEYEFYKIAFLKSLEIRNEMYIKQRHPERVKNIVDLLENPKTKPEEIILQIGNLDNPCNDFNVFMSSLKNYIKNMNKWNQKHGNPFTILNIAIHKDESGFHAHIRRVWHYKDKYGNLQIGQNKALENAGIKPPNPAEKISRFNNRKMTFDKMMRRIWIISCKKFGVNVEVKPQARSRKNENLDKEDYVRNKIEKQRLEAEKNLEKSRKERVAQAELAK